MGPFSLDLALTLTDLSHSAYHAGILTWNPLPMNHFAIVAHFTHLVYSLSSPIQCVLFDSRPGGYLANEIFYLEYDPLEGTVQS